MKEPALPKKVYIGWEPSDSEHSEWYLVANKGAGDFACENENVPVGEYELVRKGQVVCESEFVPTWPKARKKK